MSSVHLSYVHVKCLTGLFLCHSIIITPSQRCHSNSHGCPSMTASVPWCQKACPRWIITIHELNKLQWHAVLWITGAFRTSPLEGVEGIICLIPIALHLCKLTSPVYLRYSSIPANHTITSLLENGHTEKALSHRLTLTNLTQIQRKKLKSPIINVDNVRFPRVGWYKATALT